MCKHDCGGSRMNVLDLRRGECLSSGGKCNKRCYSNAWNFWANLFARSLFYSFAPLCRGYSKIRISLPAMFVAQVRGRTVFNPRLIFFFGFFSRSKIHPHRVFVFCFFSPAIRKNECWWRSWPWYCRLLQFHFVWMTYCMPDDQWLWHL